MNYKKIDSNKLTNWELLLPSITHEINNALSSLRLEMELLEMPVLLKKLDRISELTDAIMRYTQQDENKEHFHLQDCLDEALQITSSFTKPKVAIEKNEPAPVPKIYGQFNQLKQALVNIILHIVKQIKSTGKAQIRTRVDQSASGVNLIFNVKGSQLDENDSAIEVSKLLIECHEGQLVIENLNQTSYETRVLIELPIVKTPSPETF